MKSAIKFKKQCEQSVKKKDKKIYKNYELMNSFSDEEASGEEGSN